MSENEKKKKKGPVGVDRFLLVNIQSRQPLFICIGHWVATDVILVSLFMEVLFLSLLKCCFVSLSYKT